MSQKQFPSSSPQNPSSPARQRTTPLAGPSTSSPSVAPRSPLAGPSPSSPSVGASPRRVAPSSPSVGTPPRIVFPSSPLRTPHQQFIRPSSPLLRPCEPMRYRPPFRLRQPYHPSPCRYPTPSASHFHHQVRSPSMQQPVFVVPRAFPQQQPLPPRVYRPPPQIHRQPSPSNVEFIQFLRCMSESYEKSRTELEDVNRNIDALKNEIRNLQVTSKETARRNQSRHDQLSAQRMFLIGQRAAFQSRWGGGASPLFNCAPFRPGFHSFIRQQRMAFNQPPRFNQTLVRLQPSAPPLSSSSVESLAPTSSVIWNPTGSTPRVQTPRENQEVPPPLYHPRVYVEPTSSTCSSLGSEAPNAAQQQGPAEVETERPTTRVQIPNVDNANLDGEETEAILSEEEEYQEEEDGK